MAANAFLQNRYIYHEHLLSLFLIQGRTHCLRFLLLYVLESVTNPLQQLVFCYLCPPFLKNNRDFYINLDFCFEKGLFLKYFKNTFRIF